MELLDGMCDINDHVRLSAVSACSKALFDMKVVDNKVKAQGTIIDHKIILLNHFDQKVTLPNH